MKGETVSRRFHLPVEAGSHILVQGPGIEAVTDSVGQVYNHDPGLDVWFAINRRSGPLTLTIATTDPKRMMIRENGPTQNQVQDFWV